MLQLTSEHLEQYIGALEEADKAFVGDVKRDFVAQAQADIFFQLGIRDKELMKWGLNRIGIIKGQYHTSCLDIIDKFQTGKYSFDKAYGLWKDATKTSMEGMYRAGAASVGNPFYKELKLPTRDKRLLARYLNREGKFWKKFMWDVKDPKHTAFIPRDAAGKRLPGYRFKMFDYSKRAGMYPQSLEAMRYNGMLMGAGENIELRWVLGVPQTESCGDCMGLSKRVWLPRSLPTVPRGGDTACLWRCYCHLEPRQRMMRTTFDIAGRATEGAIRAAGRYSRVTDTAGTEIGGQLQREIEAYSAQMNRARQMMSVTTGADKTFWIAERKRFNRLIIDRCRAGQYRAIPTVSVSALTKTIRAAQLKGGTLVDDFMTLGLGDEVWFVRSDYSSFGLIGTRNGVRVFKSSTGVVLNLDVETDIMFLAKKEGLDIKFGKGIADLQKVKPGWNSEMAAKQIRDHLDALPAGHIKLVKKYSIDTYQDFVEAGHETAAAWYDIDTKTVHIRWDQASRHALYHEVGHAVLYKLPHKEVDLWLRWWKQAQAGVIKFPTSYALKTYHEFFAECYGYYWEKAWYPGFLDKKMIQWFDRRMKEWFPHLYGES